MATLTETPASLLLCYQMKRENGFLQQQIQKIQSYHDKQAARNLRNENLLHETIEKFSKVQQDIQQVSQELSTATGSLDTYGRDIEALKTSLSVFRDSVDVRFSNDSSSQARQGREHIELHESLKGQIDQLRVDRQKDARVFHELREKVRSCQCEKILVQLQALQDHIGLGAEMPYVHNAISTRRAADHSASTTVPRVHAEYTKPVPAFNSMEATISHQLGDRNPNKGIATATVHATSSAVNATPKRKHPVVRASATKRKISPILLNLPGSKKQAVNRTIMTQSCVPERPRTRSTTTSTAPFHALPRPTRAPVAEDRENIDPAHLPSESETDDLDRPMRSQKEDLPSFAQSDNTRECRGRESTSSTTQTEGTSTGMVGQSTNDLPRIGPRELDRNRPPDPSNHAVQTKRLGPAVVDASTDYVPPHPVKRRLIVKKFTRGGPLRKPLVDEDD